MAFKSSDLCDGYCNENARMSGQQFAARLEAADLSGEMAYPTQGGGSRRPQMAAKPGPIHRKGNQVFQTFVFKRTQSVGTLNSGQVRSDRLSLSLEQIEKIRNGDMKCPAGLSQTMLQNSFELLSKRSKNIKDNNHRAAASHALKHGFR